MSAQNHRETGRGGYTSVAIKGHFESQIRDGIEQRRVPRLEHSFHRDCFILALTGVRRLCHLFLMRSDQFDGRFAIAGTNDILTKLPLVSGDNLEAVCLASELARLQARLVIKDADTSLRGAAESCLP